MLYVLKLFSLLGPWREIITRQGLGLSQCAHAEQLTQELGDGSPDNLVDPEYEKIIRFLQKRGYNGLNLVELHRSCPGEKLAGQVQVGSFEFER